MRYSDAQLDLVGDVWAPTPGSEDFDADVLREATRRAILLDLCQRDADLREYVRWLSMSDHWWFLATWLWVDHPDTGISPMLAWDCWRDPLDCFLGLGRWAGQPLRMMCTQKSRMMGGSAMYIGAAMWDWLRRDSAPYVLGSQQARSVDDRRVTFSTSLFAKMRFYFKHLPWFLCPEPWLKSPRPREYDAGMQMALPGRTSLISGVSSTPDAARSMRATRILYDEANSIENLDATLEAASMVGAVCLVSSVKAQKNARAATHEFVRLIKGEAMPLAYGPDEPGCVMHRLHYSQRPDFDPKTESGRAKIQLYRGRMPADVWAQEMEMELLVRGEDPVWAHDVPEEGVALTQAEWDYVLQTAAESSGGAVWIDTWDFGDGPSYTVWLRALWLKAADTVYLVAHRSYCQRSAAHIAEDLDPILLGRRADYVRGDIAGARSLGRIRAGRREETARTWISELKAHGIEITGQTLVVNQAIRHVADYLRDGRLLLAPAVCRRDPGLPEAPHALDVLEHYHWTQSATDDPRPAKDRLSHLADCIQHAFRTIWSLTK